MPPAPAKIGVLYVTGRRITRCYSDRNGVTILLDSGQAVVLASDVVRSLQASLEARGRRARGRHIEGLPAMARSRWVLAAGLAIVALLSFFSWLVR
jgi:hypothetical protein